MVQKIGSGFRLKWTIPTERWYLAIACAVQALLASILTIVLPFVVKKVHHGDGFILSLLEVSVALGMLIVSIWLLPKLTSVFPKYYVSSIGLMIGSMALLLGAIFDDFLVFLSSLFLVGVGFSVYGLNGVAHRLKAFPASHRVNLMALDHSLSKLSMMLGVLATPVLLDVLGWNALLLVYALITTGLSVAVLLIPGWRRLLESPEDSVDGYYGRFYRLDQA